MAARDQSWTACLLALRPPAEPNTIVLVIGNPIDPADIPVLCERVRELLADGDVNLIVCDVSALRTPDAVAIDALARLQLTARQLGRQLLLRHACGRLQDLLALTGLREVLPACAALSVEAGGQSEEGEQARGVEEEGDPADATG